MDLPSPGSLQDLCINLLAAKTNILWRRKDGSLFSGPMGVECRDSELFLHSQLADRLLEILSHKRTLQDGILSTFTQKHACLDNVKISHSDHITGDGLQVLSHHKLISLDIRCRSRMNICTVIRCIGKKSYESLQHLVLRTPRSMSRHEIWPGDDDLTGQSVIATLFRFNCLKTLDVDDTNVTNTMMTILGKSLLHVENLNLSRNDKITDISSLENCQKTLKSLSLAGLHDMTAESAMATFMTLTGLTYLDVSLVKRTAFDSYEEYDSVSHRNGMKVFTADMLLQMLDILPNLVCLDLSGRTVRSEHALSQFLDAHPSLQTLMLWGSAACQFKSLQDYRPGLSVGGDATLEQYAAVLRHWTRVNKHQGIAYGDSQRRFVIGNLITDLQRKQFPPCGGDHLFQVVLGMLSTRSSLFHDKDKGVRSYFCPQIICLLLEKRVIRHVDPDTRQHLLQFCHRTLQNRLECDPHNCAVRIINALD